MNSEEYNLYIAQISSAILECKRNGYAAKNVNAAIDIIKSFYYGLNEEQEKSKLLEIVKSLKAKAEKAAKERKKSNGFKTDSSIALDLNSVCPLMRHQDIAKRRLYDYKCIESIMSHADNTVLLYNPIEKELIYCVENYAAYENYDVRFVDFKDILERYSQDACLSILSNLCAEAHRHEFRELIVYKNISALKSDPMLFRNFCYFVNEIKRQEAGDSISDVLYAETVQQIIFNTDSNFRFEQDFRNVLKDFNADTVSLFVTPGIISYTFLSIPTFFVVYGELSRAFVLDPDDIQSKNFIQKFGISLGYSGLTELLQTAIAENWQEELQKITSSRSAQFDEFVHNTGLEAGKLIPSDWGFEVRHDKEKVPGTPIRTDMFDGEIKYRLPDNELYDIMVDGAMIRKNMQIILDSDYSPMQKCGWAVSYALDNGDSMNIVNLSQLSQAERSRIMQERWEIAYDALSQLMRIPRGTLVFDIDSAKEPGLNGMCCRGGELIRMNKKYLDTSDTEVISEGCDTMLHELYHSLEHVCLRALPFDKRTKKFIIESADEQILGYYFKYFNVSVSRIYQWAVNEDRYRPSNENFENYYDQVFEADARIFAADTLDMFANMNPPDLN